MTPDPGETLRPTARALLEHTEFLRALARSLVRDAATADDVVQDTMVRALERPPRHRDNLRGWLGRVVRNLSLGGHRTAHRRRAREHAAARPDRIDPTADAAARAEVQSVVARAVRELDETDRTVIVLRFFDGLMPREIARRLDVPVSTVHTRLQRALARLRARLDRSHGRRAWTGALAPLLIPKGALLMFSKTLIVATVLAVAASTLGWRLLHDRTEKGDRTVSLAREHQQPPIQGAPSTPQQTNDDVLSSPKTPAVEAPDEPAVPGVRAALVLLDEATGHPIAGAHVHVLYAGPRDNPARNRALEPVLEREPERGPILSLITMLDRQDLAVLARKDSNTFRLKTRVSDDGGHVLIDGLPAGVFHAIVLSPQHVPHRLRAVPTGDAPKTIRLKPGGGLLVRAKTLGGQPTDGLVCEVLGGGLGARPVARAVFSATGELSFPHLAPGRYRVALSGAQTENRPRFRTAERSVTIAAGNIAVLDFGATKTATLEGRFTRRGEPVRAGLVYLYDLDREHRPGLEAQLDEDARFRFDALEPGRYELTVANETGTLISKSVTIRPDEPRQTVEVAMPLGVLEGTVLDAEGKPLAEADITIERSPADRALVGQAGERVFLRGLTARTGADAQGRFTVTGLDAGKYRVLYGTGGAFAAVSLTLADAETKSVSWRFDPRALAALSVRAVDPDGRPVKAAFLLRGEDGNIAELYASESRPFATAEFTARLPRGRYRVWVAAAGFADRASYLIEVAGDGPITVPLVRGVTVRLRFLRNELPRVGAIVEIVDEDGVRAGSTRNAFELMTTPRLWRTDKAGNIAVRTLAPGSYAVSINGEAAGELIVADQPIDRVFFADG